MLTSRRHQIFVLIFFLLATTLPAAWAQTLVGTVTVGTNPVGVAINPATNKIYVANRGSNNVTVINGGSLATTTVTVGNSPSAIATNFATNKIYVANQSSGNITIIDGVTLGTSNVTVGSSPSAIAVNPVTNKIYVVNTGSNSVTVINGSTLAASSISVGSGPAAVAINQVTNTIYVANRTGNSVTVINGNTLSTSTVTVGNQPVALAVNPVTNFIYVANQGSNTVTAINGSNNSASNIAVGTQPVSVAVNSASNKIYTANNADGTVTAIDGVTKTTTTVTAGTQPAQIAADPVTNKMYLTNTGSNSATMIDGAALWVTNVAVGGAPGAIAINAVNDRIYVANAQAGTVSVLGGVGNSSLQFVPLPPCRVADTRKANGPFGGPAITGGTSRSFALPQSACNIPSTAVAASLNVTVVPNGSLAYLTIWPTGEDQPVVSTMNSLDGRIKANAAVVPSGYLGGVSVYVTNTTNVVLDVNGYFVPTGDPALAFYPLPPCRVLDTRNSNGPLGGPSLQAATPRSFPVQSGTCDIPSNAAAYSMNFTVVPKGIVGYLTVWPTGQTQPVVSTLNDLTGTIVANAAVVPAGDAGAISVYSTNDTDLVGDIDGYFAPITNDGLSLYAASPCRVLDTRGGNGAFNGALNPPVDVGDSVCGPPASSQAYVFNATVIPQGPLGYLTLWPDGQQRPTVSTLNAVDAAITSNMAIVPSSNGKVDAYAAGTTNLVLDLASSFAPLSTLAIQTTSLPSGVQGVPYSATLGAIGGIPPYTWSITSGSLPAGLTLDPASGNISGTPTGDAGTYPFAVQVQDSQGNTQTANISLIIQGGELTITTSLLPNGTVTIFYNAALQAAGGTPPYTWSVITGELPPGLDLDTHSGIISGTPTSAGNYTFTIKVQDSLNDSAQKSLQIIINPQTTNGALSGNYAFSFNGYRTLNALQPGTAGPNLVTMAGSFTADGNGNLTSGVVDLNSNGLNQINLPLQTGSVYDVTANGLGTLTLVTSQGTFNFSVSVSSTGNGRMIQDNADPATRGSGVIYVQDPTSFKLPVQGGYAFGLSGADVNAARQASAGAFVLTNLGTINGGMRDSNDNGTVTSSQPFSGSFQSPSNTTGRGTFTLTTGGVTLNYAYYAVNTSQFVVIGTDPLSANNPLALGTLLVETSTTFTNASLKGVSIFQLNGVNPNVPRGNGSGGATFLADTTVGVFNNPSGAGAGSFAGDENLGGSMSQPNYAVTYTVANNGRALLSNFGSVGPVIYITSPNITQNGAGFSGFVLGTDAEVTVGLVQPQAVAPYPIVGIYLGGTVTPAVSAVTDTVDYLTADQSGNMTITEKSSGPGGTGSTQYTLTYTVDSTGRVVVSDGSGQFSVGYVLSPKSFLLIPSGGNADNPNASTPAISIYAVGATGLD